MDVAKVFTNGKSQAIRLPKAYRFSTDEVYITKQNGKVILLPKPKITWEEFFSNTEPFPDFQLDRNDNVEPQQRKLF
jgi:antitoxin VapB